MLDLWDEDMQFLHSQAALEGSINHLYTNCSYNIKVTRDMNLFIRQTFALAGAGHVSTSLAAHKLRPHARAAGKERAGTEEDR